jgi:hypothetical protein
MSRVGGRASAPDAIPIYKSLEPWVSIRGHRKRAIAAVGAEELRSTDIGCNFDRGHRIWFW